MCSFHKHVTLFKNERMVEGILVGEEGGIADRKQQKSEVKTRPICGGERTKLWGQTELGSNSGSIIFWPCDPCEGGEGGEGGINSLSEVNKVRSLSTDQTKFTLDAHR